MERKTLLWYKRYFTYVCRHKYYVWKACFRMWLYWQWIIHDLSKFLPCEYMSYMRYFSLGDKSDETKKQFDYSWNHHLKNNKHHRQYWILLNDDGSTKALDMPEKYIKEMLCDWRWVGRAFMKDADRYKYDAAPRHEVYNWYCKNRHKMQLSDSTRNYVESFLQKHRMTDEKNFVRYDYEEWNSWRYKGIYNDHFTS